jgi:hypothetical protein
MAYDNIAILPFLLDASHLTQEELAERSKNPALWASKRYGQPEHIFEAAGKPSTVLQRAIVTLEKLND